MVKGLYSAWSGMVNEMNRMDIMTNNLANADTNGYKKEGATSQTFSEQLAVKIKDQSDNGQPVTLGGMYPGVKIGETYTDYSQGSFQVTDSQYDVALDGDGFFAIAFTNKNGETSVKYTRDGAFTVNTEGYLVTKDGDYVLNQNGADNTDPGAGNRIRLDPNQTFTIDEKGDIWQNEVQVATLGVVDFENYDYLEKYGENLYQTVDGATLTDSSARVRQGYIEASNVNVVTEMVNMITITRAYESNQKVLQTEDSLLDRAVNNVGRV
jgi:flagellar basal-body rod protein FlgG